MPKITAQWKRDRSIKRRPKKKKEAVELVTACDQCSKSFRVTIARTTGSAFTAYGCGISFIDPSLASNKRKVNKWMFFCSQECLDKFNADIHAF